jgi:hypothetical protein
MSYDMRDAYVVQDAKHVDLQRRTDDMDEDFFSSFLSVAGHPVTYTAVVVLQWLVGRIEGVCEDLGLRRVD